MYVTSDTCEGERCHRSLEELPGKRTYPLVDVGQRCTEERQSVTPTPSFDARS